MLYGVQTRDLARELEDNVAFAARFYKAIATFLSDRIREATASKEDKIDGRASELDGNVLDNLDRAGSRFDDLGRRLLDK